MLCSVVGNLFSGPTMLANGISKGQIKKGFRGKHTPNYARGMNCQCLETR